MFLNKESYGCFQSLVKTNRTAPILQLNLVILATLREYSIFFSVLKCMLFVVR